MVVQVERPWKFIAKRLDFLIADFFGLSPKFGHSIPWPLDFGRP